MPNWCENYIELSHEDAAMIERAERAFTDNRFLAEFIPIPEDKTEDWYNFCVENWGTKWDVGSDNVCIMEDGKTLIASFDSAWSPPIAAYATLEQMGFTIRAMYHEPGLAFAGIWEDGVDEGYSDWGNSEEAKEMLPQELDEFFCISESLADWEDWESENPLPTTEEYPNNEKEEE